MTKNEAFFLIFLEKISEKVKYTTPKTIKYAIPCILIEKSKDKNNLHIIKGKIETNEMIKYFKVYFICMLYFNYF